MSADAIARGRAERRGAAEDDQSDDQRAPTTEAVAERAGREQERRERERVGVDDPLLLRLAGVEAGGEMGEAVGEHRDAGDDHHEGEAHHREDRVAVGEGRRRRWPRCAGAERSGFPRVAFPFSSVGGTPLGTGSGTVSRSDSDAASATIRRHPPVCKGVLG